MKSWISKTALGVLVLGFPIAGLATDTFDNAYREAPVSSGPPAIKFVGRFDRTDPAGPRFTWPGTELIARFEGRSVSVTLAHSRILQQSPIYYTYIVDGGKRQSFAATGTTPRKYVLADHLGPGPHDVMLERETEGVHGVSQFEGFDFGTGGALLPPYGPTARRIEIIGDSITAGYGDNGGAGCHYSTATQSAFIAYGSIAARELRMDLTTIAFSGKGIHNNWNTVGNDPMNPTMLHDFLYTLTPSIYTPGQSDEGKFLYDFRATPPDLVVINLGTNDFRNPSLTRSEFASSYVSMISLIRSKYPHARIYAAVGSILEEPALDTLRAAVQDAVGQVTSAGDPSVRYVELTRDGTTWAGCDDHPDASQQQDLANLLVSAIRQNF